MKNFKSHTSLPNKIIATKFIFIKNLKSVGRENKNNNARISGLSKRFQSVDGEQK